MERLTERNENGKAITKTLEFQYLIDRLADYEDAEEQGVLMQLPCRVGDTVWCLTSANTKYVECTVLWIEIHKNGILVFSLDGGHGDVVLKHLGETWFITRDEAEKALEMQKG